MKFTRPILSLFLLGFVTVQNYAQTTHNLNIGVLLPFYSDTSSGISQKQISQAALDYYAGMRIAANDLNEWNISVNLRVWDVQKMNDSALIKLPKSAEFQELDVFVGPISQKHVDLISTNLQHTRFLWVSPLTTLKLPKAVQNINFFSHDSLRVKGLIQQLKLDFPDHQFCLISDKKNTNTLKYYKKELKAAKIAFSEHQYNGSKISPKISFKSESIILLNSGTSSFSRLAEFPFISRKVDSYIVGDLSWIDEVTAAEEIDETRIIYPSVNFINGIDSASLIFTEKFIQEELSEPSKFAFQAYDQLFYLGAHFASKGRFDITEIPKAAYPGLINNFHLVKTGQNTFQNQGIRLIRNEKVELVEVEEESEESK